MEERDKKATGQKGIMKFGFNRISPGLAGLLLPIILTWLVGFCYATPFELKQVDDGGKAEAVAYQSDDKPANQDPGKDARSENVSVVHHFSASDFEELTQSGIW